MKTKRFFHLAIVLLLVSSAATAQGLFSTGEHRGAGLLSGNLPDNARFGLEMGTSFTSFGGSGMLGNFISPRLEYDVSPSFTLITGGTISFNRYSGLEQPLVLNNNNNTSFRQQGPTDYSVFMSGRYMINDNLMVTGTVYSEEGQLPLMMMMNPALGSYSSRGMSMGLEYRITENLRFGAEVGMNRSNNPYHLFQPYNDPFGTRRYNRSRSMFSPF